MHSLFEEQIIHESLKLHEDLMRGTESYAEALNYLPDYGQYTVGPETYLENLKMMKQALSIPVIGSLNGVSTGGWIRYAEKIQDAGADALELNIYYLSTDPELTASELEDTYITLVEDIRKCVAIPIAVKLSPFFTSLPNFARRLSQTGVNGIVLFNRFYQPDFDLEELEVVPNLSSQHVGRNASPLRWIAILYGRIQADLAMTGGVHTGADIIKALMAGASATTIASEFLQNGPARVAGLLSEVTAWMEEHEYESVMQMKGSMSQQAVAQPGAFERANYMKVLSSY